MSTVSATKRLVEIPADVWAALRLKPGAPLQWELRGGEAVMRPAGKRAPAVDEVFGMLGKHVKRSGHKAVTPAAMRAAAKQAAARRASRPQVRLP